MTESANIPIFRVGDAFPSGDEERVSLVRFLVAAQSLPALTRIVPVLPGSAAFRESKHYLMLLSLGAAHEAANAFWGAHEHGLFAQLSSLDFDGIDECISRLAIDCSPDCPDSLRSRLVRHCRNKFAFHWDMDEVRKSLSQVKDVELPAWAGGENFITNALPLVECVSLRGLQSIAGSEDELQELMQRVPRFTLDLARVAEAAYAMALDVVLKRRSDEDAAGA